MREAVIYQVDSFTTELFAGNPAGVVPDADHLTDTEMAKIARELNNSETAFILSPQDAAHRFRLRFFTPTTEVPSCGHATLAAHIVWTRERQCLESKLVFENGIGAFRSRLFEKDGTVFARFDQGDFAREPLSAGERDLLLSALDLDAASLLAGGPVEWVSTGHSKIIVPLKDKALLDGLMPDFEKLRALHEKRPNAGIFVFCFAQPDAPNLTHGRMFAPQIGIPEDPVTGNGNDPLGGYLVANRLIETPQNGQFRFIGRQGEAIGRPGEVHVEVAVEGGAPTRISISGTGRIVFKSRIRLNPSSRL